MKHFTLLFFFLVYSSFSFGQNWKGISNSDTTFFTASTLPPDSEWNGLLRCVWVESSMPSGSDSVFIFNKAVRDVITSPCFDTSGMTWLGPQMIRTMSGVEYYSNAEGDSLEFHTNANMGDTWKITSDSTGLDFYATVTNEYTMFIDGVLDSVKEFKLQAWQGTTMVSNYYNNFVLKLSKEHGFISIVQLEIFPYQTYADFFYVSNLHPALPYNHIRIGNTINIDYEHIDLAAKYAAGNEWIYESSYGYGEYELASPTDAWNGFVTTNHDSIISSILLSSTAIEYTYQRKQNYLAKSCTYNTSTSTYSTSVSTINNISIKTDTVYQSTSSKYLHAKNCSDVFYLLDSSIVRPYHFFVDTVCSYLRIRSDSSEMPFWQRTASCWEQIYPVFGYTYYRTSQIAGMGFMEGYKKSLGVSYQLTFNSASKLHYLKTNSCTYLNKFNVLLLGTSNDELVNKSVEVYPNPVLEQINIRLNDPYNSIISAKIIDLSGALVLESLSTSTQLNTSQIKPGIYFLELKTSKGNVVKKIVK